MSDKYRGGVLPGQAVALMVALGVSDKVKDRARQTFERSAEQVGFLRTVETVSSCRERHSGREQQEDRKMRSLRTRLVLPTQSVLVKVTG
jgi:hypothetical protein